MTNLPGKVRVDTHSGLFLCWLCITPRVSPCKPHPRQMAKTTGLEKLVHEDRLHMRLFSGTSRLLATDSSTVVAYINKRTNPLSVDVCSPVKNHEFVSLLQNITVCQERFRVSKCDGRLIVQGKCGHCSPKCSSGSVKSGSLICHSFEPQTSSVCNPSSRPTSSEHRLDGSHNICLPSQGCNCHIILIAPDWPRMPWFGDLVQPSTVIPLKLPA